MASYMFRKEQEDDETMQDQQGQHQDMMHDSHIAHDNEPTTEVPVPAPNDLPSRIIAIGQLALAKVLLIVVIVGSFVLGIGKFLKASANVPFTIIGVLSAGLWIISGVLTLFSSRFSPNGMYRTCIISWVIQLLGNFMLFVYAAALAFGLAGEHPYRVYWSGQQGFKELFSVEQTVGITITMCIVQFILTVFSAIGVVQIYVARRRLSKLTDV